MSSPKVKCLALSTGQIIVGLVTSTNGVNHVKNPTLLGLNPPQRPGDSPSLGMADFLPLADEKTVSISDQHVVYSFDPDQKIKDGWNQMFGNGLVLPNTGIIKPR